MSPATKLSLNAESLFDLSNEGMKPKSPSILGKKKNKIMARGSAFATIDALMISVSLSDTFVGLDICNKMPVVANV